MNNSIPYTSDLINTDQLLNQVSIVHYPAIYVENPTQAFAVIISDLYPGDVQLIVKYNGMVKHLVSISESAINIKMLLLACSNVYLLTDKNTTLKLNTVQDYLDHFNK